ncbi:MAG TPA: hypothetical protein VGP84_23190 [Gemmatimonadaceae bacterium]|nr:hypothetical protein [Gemmatimonadaceae bacterium]
MKSLVFRSRDGVAAVALALPPVVIAAHVRAGDGGSMKQLLTGVVTIGFLIACAAPVMAQAQTRDSAKKASAIPADARPPKGMCRIWIDGVPAAQQPAATDCPTAVKNRPANARVIFGDDFTDTTKSKTGDKSKLPPNVKGFTGVKPPEVILPKRPPAQ